MKILKKYKFIIFIVILFYNYNTYSQNNEIKNWVYYLSNDSLLGRSNGSPELKIVSNWISKKLDSFGVNPYYSQYFQNYSYEKNNRLIKERNVIGIINGSNKIQNDYVIISAHFDHIGIVQNEIDSICNGAEDNASGVALLLSIAKQFHEKKIKPKKSIIFAFFSGEEDGLKGSDFFTQNIGIDKDDIVVNINFDMVGRSEFLGKKRFYISGFEYSNLYSIVTEFNKNREWTIKRDLGTFGDLLFRMSDNYSFVNGTDSLGIPAHTFGIGLPDETFLHNPNDEPQYIDYQNLSSFSDYITDLICYLTSKDINVNWIKDYNEKITIDVGDYNIEIK
jgi:Zn-dependent M28 family amino/carboxypeptidase